MSSTTDAARMRPPSPPYVLALSLLIIGIILIGGGAYLVASGGSFYYIVAGALVSGSALLLFQRRPLGAYLYAGMLALTLVWSIWEVGYEPWGLTGRLLGPCVLGLWLLTPFVRRGLIATPAPDPARRKKVVLAAGAAFTLAFVAANALHRPPVDPAYRTGVSSGPGSKTTPPTDIADDGADWVVSGRTLANTKYSPLDEINAANVSKLKVAWTYALPYAGPDGAAYRDEAIPLKVRDKLFVCAPTNIVAAVDAETGKEVWRFDPRIDAAKNEQNICRGVSYYRSDKPLKECRERIITQTLDARLIALDAGTGKKCGGFGKGGEVSLLEGMGEQDNDLYTPTSPPTIVRGIAVIGSKVLDNVKVGEPSGVIRGFDAVTGKLVWAWDMQHPDRVGAPPKGETYTRGTPNSWTLSSADENLGLVYIPMGNASPDLFGGLRDRTWEAYSSALVALDVKSGRPRWVFQTTHHDIWDYDQAAAPTLVDWPKDGVSLPAVIVTSKQGEVFVLDRRNGAPLSDVVEKPAPQGAVEGDYTSPTQPISEDMPAFSGPDLREADTWGLTPLDQMWCRIQFRKYRYEGRYTPPSLQGTLEYPGYAGGIDWGGASVDPSRNVMVVLLTRTAMVMKLFKREWLDTPEGRTLPDMKPMRDTPYGATITPFLSPLKVPCQSPPFAQVAAVDLTTKKLLWIKTLGTAREIGPGNMQLGLDLVIGAPPIAGGALTTKGGVAFMGASNDNWFRALDIRTGKELWRANLPAGGQASPISFKTPAGRQMVAIVSGQSVASGSRADKTTIVAYSLR